ncbi:MAG: RNA polymerase factor sigma-54 [Candidatus Eisenbacteria bacterium]|uniref:RNA polymerase factor sigma-54 n=1 Tax=Eiseniibacteriota bacterium TaxID=2212470 RepID=A0A538TIZ3_UNCEI|nr:MAG: RNA polymerase factor sigma-54 [Candidatus Eisenbacteria bacterium]TMQ63585.1 MAG: RNA polymerase factor sigma-54 [Candidatus Eisenbacteria bacterium]
MEMKHSLSMQQKPTLIMTQRLQHALKLLQMPTLELQQALKMELERNPLLEEVDEVEEVEEIEEVKKEVGQEEVEQPAVTEAKAEQEIDWGEMWPDQFETVSAPRTNDGDAEFYERVPVTVKTLGDHLLEQLRLSNLDEQSMAIGEFLVGSIDENGYLQTRVEEVGETFQVSPERVEEVLAVIQTFEPAGIGARNLQECLWIQIVQKKMETTLAGRIIQEQFDNLLAKRFSEIARNLKCTVEDVQAASDTIGTLDPRPAQEIAAEETRYVVPDLIVERVGEDFVVALNDRNVPRLRISHAYQQMLRNKNSVEDTTRKYITEKLNSAKWLIQTIEQRRKTMIKVMRRIVEEQREFFERGVEGLRPLTLQQIANQIGMHESTVSRVTTNKYVQTPRGVFELKYFFSSGLQTEDGDDVSAKVAKGKISQLIQGEDKREPLSDQRIAELLHEQGLRIARRTVAKYREALRILPARARRRYASRIENRT